MYGEDGYFDERVAARYDESEEGMFDPALVRTVVDVLAELADGGNALELGIGTGRIARFRLLSAGFVCTASICLKRWSRDSDPSRAAKPFQ